jgi:RNA polymerase sigma-70 factor (ECF subfamily)
MPVKVTTGIIPAAATEAKDSTSTAMTSAVRVNLFIDSPLDGHSSIHRREGSGSIRIGNPIAPTGVGDATKSVEGRPLDEQELIAKAKSGNVGAFEELVRMHQQSALRVAYFVSGDADAAEDVAQEAFVKAYRALPRFREESAFRPWLLRIVRNEALNDRRRRGRQERLSLRLSADPVSGGTAQSPETTVVTQQNQEAVLAAVERLPERGRQVVALRYLIGLSEEETATTLGVPVGTVKSRTSRALRALERALGDREGAAK